MRRKKPCKVIISFYLYLKISLFLLFNYQLHPVDTLEVCTGAICSYFYVKEDDRLLLGVSSSLSYRHGSIKSIRIVYK